MRCPHCSLEIPIGQQFCGNCGKRVDVGFEHIRDSVLSDAADRRAGIVEKILLNAIGVLVVLWVGLKLLNDHYLETEFPAARPASRSFSAPTPEVETDDRIEFEVAPVEIAVPRVPTQDARGMSWRRSPFKEKMLEANCTRAQQEAVSRALAAGLKFLASRQGKDGGWYVSQEGGDKINDWGRPGITGLACLTFLGDGHTWVGVGEDSKGAPLRSPYGDQVKRAIRFLTMQQQTDGEDAGLIGPKRGHFMYNQGMATAALCEAYAMSGDPCLRRAATRAINYIISAQQRSGGWDYYEKPGSRSDTSVTCCQLMALYSAHLAGLKVPATVFRNGLRWVDSVTDHETFNVGYDKKWDRGERHVGYGSTAMGLMLQLYLGRSPSAESVRRQARTLLALRPPQYNPKWDSDQKADKLDYYYVYHGTMAFHRLGGGDWKTWNAAMINMLCGSQEDKGKMAGSWPAVDVHGDAGGTIFSTAAALLALESYYRYP